MDQRSDWEKNYANLTVRVGGETRHRMRVIAETQHSALWKIGNQALALLLACMDADDGAEIAVPFTDHAVIVRRATGGG